MHPLSRLCAVAFGLAFLVGLPYVLFWHVAWPELPVSWDVALAHLRGWRLPPGVFPAALIAALWVLWGLFALALATETAARLRGLPLRLRPLGPLQAIAATAVAATVVTPAAAFADALVQADDRDGETSAADRGDGVPEAPQSTAEQGPVERTRTVSGFGLGSAELSERMREDLAPTVEMLGNHWDESVPVQITGHTDPSGDPERNRELSEERARAVADYLEESLGEDAPDTEVGGAGSDQPAEGPPESQRRIEIAYTLEPAPTPVPAPRQEGGADADGAAAEVAAEAEPPVVTMENASEVTGEDGPRVVVLEIPDGAAAAAVGFVGLAGGYLLGRHGSLVPRMALSLPRGRLLPGRPRRLALPASPGRPVPDDEIDERVTVELDHVPGLGLTGKGADAAVRRLITNALDPFEPLAVRILITDREAVRLLGETGRDLLRDRPCEPVTLVPAMEDALAALASELHATATEERAPIALITSPVPQHEHALSGLLLHGQHRGVTAVILGSWPLGGNCVVDLDGLISQTSQPLATLFHCSWAGSDAEEVHEAVIACHEADHSLSERPERPSSRRDTEAREAELRRPVLVAEDWDDDDAFAPVGDGAVWERLTRLWGEEAESTDDDGSDAADLRSPAGGTLAEDAVVAADANRDPGPWNRTVPDDGVAIGDAFGAFQDSGGGTGTAAVDDHDDSWWDETPSADVEDADQDEDGHDGSAEPEGPRAPVPEQELVVDVESEAVGAVEPTAETADPSTALTGAARAEPPTGDSPRSGGEAAREDSGVGNPGAAPPADASQRPADRPPAARRAEAPAPEGRQDKEVRHERAPGRKAGRVRVVRVDRPTSPEPGERSPGPVRPRTVQRPLRDTGVSGPVPKQQARTAVAVPVLSGQGADSGEVPLSDRPQPAKPRKAGRARSLREGD